MWELGNSIEEGVGVGNKTEDRVEDRFITPVPNSSLPGYPTGKNSEGRHSKINTCSLSWLFTNGHDCNLFPNGWLTLGIP